MSALGMFTQSAAANVDALAAGYRLGVGRAVPTAAAVLAAIGVVAGSVALARARRTGPALVVSALILGLLGVVAGVLHGANAAGGPGTGNGVVGAVVAVALGVASIALGGLAAAHSGLARR